MHAEHDIDQPQAFMTSSRSLVRDFFNAVQCTVERAFRVSNRTARSIRFGGRTIRLEFASAELAQRLTPALAHLLTAGNIKPSARIFVWDTSATGIEPPESPWAADEFSPRGEIQGLESERFRVAYALGSGVLSLFDRVAQVGFFWVRDAALLPRWEIAAPMRTIFSWLANDLGQQLAHAAAVGLQSGGVLLAGRGGSGKSTTALACLQAGMFYSGDDYVLLCDKDGPAAYSLYNTAKLFPDDLRGRLPALATHALNNEGPGYDKEILLLKDDYGDRLAENQAIRAVVVPRVGSSQRSRITPISPVRALNALVPTTICQLPNAGSPAIAYLSRFVRQVPSFEMTLGENLDEIVGGIRALIAKEVSDAA